MILELAAEHDECLRKAHSAHFSCQSHTQVLPWWWGRGGGDARDGAAGVKVEMRENCCLCSFCQSSRLNASNAK